MDSEIRARKKKFVAFVTVMMLVMCSIVPAFAATHTADEWITPEGIFDRSKDYYVNPGDDVQIPGPHTLYEYYNYKVAYYDDGVLIKEVQNETADDQYADGSYYFGHTVLGYSDIVGETEKAALFKNWKITGVYKSGRYGGYIYLTAQFYESYNISYELDGGTNDSDNPDTYISGTGVTEFKPAVKEGYTFDGWYSDAEFKTPVTSIEATQTGDVTLYAKFTQNSESNDPVNPEDPENPENPEGPENPENPENPETPEIPEVPGDNDPKLGEDNIAVFLTGLMGLAGLGIFTMTLKKRRESEQN